MTRVFTEPNPFSHLKTLVEVLLDELGMQHKDAAERAGISKPSWHAALRDNHPTPHRIEVIAKGLGMEPAEFVVELDRVRREIANGIG